MNAKIGNTSGKVEDPQVLAIFVHSGAMEEKTENFLSMPHVRCKLCEEGPAGAVEYVEDEKKKKLIRVSRTNRCFYVDHVDGEIHPVTYELIGKAIYFGRLIDQSSSLCFIYGNISDKAEELLHYGVDI